MNTDMNNVLELLYRLHEDKYFDSGYLFARKNPAKKTIGHKRHKKLVIAKNRKRRKNLRKNRRNNGKHK